MRLDEALDLAAGLWERTPPQKLRIEQKSWWNRQGNQTGIFGYDIVNGDHTAWIEPGPFWFGRLYTHTVNPHLHAFEYSTVHRSAG